MLHDVAPWYLKTKYFFLINCMYNYSCHNILSHFACSKKVLLQKCITCIRPWSGCLICFIWWNWTKENKEMLLRCSAQEECASMCQKQSGKVGPGEQSCLFHDLRVAHTKRCAVHFAAWVAKLFTQVVAVWIHNGWDIDKFLKLPLCEYTHLQT